MGSLAEVHQRIPAASIQRTEKAPQLIGEPPISGRRSVKPRGFKSLAVVTAGITAFGLSSCKNSGVEASSSTARPDTSTSAPVVGCTASATAEPLQTNPTVDVSSPGILVGNPYNFFEKNVRLKNVGSDLVVTSGIPAKVIESINPNTGVTTEFCGYTGLLYSSSDHKGTPVQTYIDESKIEDAIRRSINKDIASLTGALTNTVGPFGNTVPTFVVYSLS